MPARTSMCLNTTGCGTSSRSPRPSRDPDLPTAHLLGELLVVPRSAAGDTDVDNWLAFPADHAHRLGGLHHFGLLNHPAA